MMDQYTAVFVKVYDPMNFLLRIFPWLYLQRTGLKVMIRVMIPKWHHYMDSGRVICI